MGLFLQVLFLLSASSAQSGEVQPGTDASEQFLEYERNLIDAAITRRPWLAAERGVIDRVGDLIGSDAESFGNWEQALERGIRDLRTVEAHALPIERALDHAWLLGWAQAELIQAQMLQISRRDPDLILHGVERTLLALTPIGTPPSLERAKALTRALNRVPATLEYARTNVRSPLEPWVKTALERTRCLETLIKHQMASSLEGLSLSDREQKKFEEERDEALKALTDYAGWLREREPALLQLAMPSPAWQAMARALLGLELDLEELDLSLLAEIGDLQGKVGELTPPSTPATAMEPWVAASEVQSLIEHYALSAERAELLRTSGSPRLEVRAEEECVDPLALARIRRNSLGCWTLLLNSRGTDASADPFALDSASLPLLALRYGMTGEGFLRAQQAASLSLTRTWIENDLLSEAFGCYAMTWPFALGWLDREHTAVERRTFRLLCVEAARAYVALQLYGKGITATEARRLFANLARVDMDAAEREVAWMCRDPGRGLGYIAFRCLRSVEERMAAEQGREASIRAILALVSGHPTARIGDLVRQVEAQLGDSKTENR